MKKWTHLNSLHLFIIFLIISYHIIFLNKKIRKLTNVYIIEDLNTLHCFKQLSHLFLAVFVLKAILGETSETKLINETQLSAH